DHFRLLGRRAGGDAALGFEDDFLATDELVVVEAEMAALAVGFVDGVGDAFALPLAAVHLADGVEGHGLAVGAGDDVAVGAHALAVLERDPADEGQAKGEQDAADAALAGEVAGAAVLGELELEVVLLGVFFPGAHGLGVLGDRKSTRLNSSHVKISYAVFCLKKKMKQN